MAESPLDVLLKGNSGRTTRGLLRIIILATIAAAAVSSRLFSVIRMSSPLHEDRGIYQLVYVTDIDSLGFESIIHECMFNARPSIPISMSTADPTFDPWANNLISDRN